MALTLSPLPASLAASCARPVLLPTDVLSRADVERLWARDRAALVKCGVSHDGLVAHYEDLSRRLAAAKP